MLAVMKRDSEARLFPTGAARERSPSVGREERECVLVAGVAACQDNELL